MRKIITSLVVLLALAAPAIAGPGIGISIDPNSMTGNGSTATPIGLTHACAAGQDLVYDGVSWGCALAGDITSVGAASGGGLTGGASSGPALLSLLTTCGTNQILKWSGSAWLCANDATGSGTVTNIATTAPISGGPITSTGTIGLTNCGANQIYKENGTGTAWGCAADSDSGTISGVAAVTPLTGGGTSGNVTIQVGTGDWGDVVTSGTGGAIWTVDARAITYAKIQAVSATNRLLCRITAGAGDIEECTGTQATTLLDPVSVSVKGLVPVAPNDTTKFFRGDATWSVPPTFGTSNAGYATASGGGTTNFLRADGSWTAPPSLSGLTTTYLLKAASATTANDSHLRDTGSAIQVMSSVGGSPTVIFDEATGNTVIGGDTQVNGNTTLNGDTTMGNATTDDVIVTGSLAGAVYYSGTAASLGTCVGGTIGTNSNGARGRVTAPDNNCTINFNITYAAVPSCDVTVEHTASGTTVAIEPTTTTLTVHLSSKPNGLSYRCDGLRAP